MCIRCGSERWYGIIISFLNVTVKIGRSEALLVMKYLRPNVLRQAYDVVMSWSATYR